MRCNTSFVSAPGHGRTTGRRSSRPVICAVGHSTSQGDLKLCSARRPRGYWKKPENLAREVKDFVVAHGEPGRMPTEAELREAGRVDLAIALRRNGGWEPTANNAGLVLTSYVRPRSIYLSYCVKLRPGTLMRPHKYWNEFENLKRELMDFMETRMPVKQGPRLSYRTPALKAASLSVQLMLPSTRDLEHAGRYDIIRAIHKHGGFEAVARRLDLRFRYHSSGYWRKFENVEKEIRLLIETFGTPAEMPPLRALSLHGPPGLHHAVSQIHGGKHAVAHRLGLRNRNLRRGYWCLAENRKAAVLDLIRKISEGGDAQNLSMMPSKRAIIAAGRAELAQAIDRHGGFQKMAEELGLEYKGRGRSAKERTSLCSCCKVTIPETHALELETAPVHSVKDAGS